MFCSLCEIELPQQPIVDGSYAFCCTGCHAVFNILSSRGQAANFHDTPLFHQALRSGLISNPALLEQIRQKKLNVPELELQRLHLEIGEMWCPSCAEIIRLMLLQEKGIQNCIVDYTTDLASIEYSPKHISKEKIANIIKTLGYQATTFDNLQKTVSSDLYLRFGIAAFCALNTMMFAYPIYATYFDRDGESYSSFFAWLSFFFTLPVLFYSCVPIIKRFVNSFKVGLYGMETLVVIGTSTAFGLSIYELFQGGTRVYFDSMTVIIAFVLLGKIIEAKAKFNAKDSLFRLAKSVPKRGRKQQPEGTISFVPMKDIRIGDHIVVYAGEKIVLDGVVLEGNATCDESLMTGESIPVNKTTGSTVLGGTIVQNGTLHFRVTSPPEATALNKILDVVQQEIGQKTHYIRAADKIVSLFVPIVILLSIGTATWCLLAGFPTETALIRAISVLLISCPCAIGIAAPLAEAHVMNSLASLGAIVRNRGCLTLLGRETFFAFDKTGTVTEGHFKVLSGLDSLAPDMHSVLKGIASQSRHPIATAISNSISVPPAIVIDVQEYAGKGLSGIYEGKKLLLGSSEFLQLHLLTIPKESSHDTTVYFTYDGICLTALTLGDQIRADIQEVLASLSPAKTVLLSGDSNSTVAAVAKSCGFHTWQARCHPLQKREYIDELRKQGHLVCMIGDGINDAPALTAAHLGISVVSATDISIQVSDILLTTDRLSVIPKMRQIARKGQKIIRQNLFWTFFYNVVGLPLAAMGLMSPIFAAFAMVTSSVIVLINSQRVNPGTRAGTGTNTN